MSDTPRTDAYTYPSGDYHESDKVVLAAFAKQLERELNAEKAEVERLTKCLREANESMKYFEMHCYLMSEEAEKLAEKVKGIGYKFLGKQTPARTVI